MKKKGQLNKILLWIKIFFGKFNALKKNQNFCVVDFVTEYFVLLDLKDKMEFLPRGLEDQNSNNKNYFKIIYL